MPATTEAPSLTTLQAKVTALSEPWTSAWDLVAKHAPRYVSAYTDLRSVPSSNRHLSPKLQELVLLAVDASCTHVFVPGVKLHTEQALKAGATKEEIIEVLQLTSVLGIHSTLVGVPTLIEVLKEEGKLSTQMGQALKGEGLNEYQERLKTDFQASRGYWSPHWDPILALMPDWFAAYTEFSSLSSQPGVSVLSNKEKELIYTAIDVSTTHLYVPGLKVHVRNAVRYGATPEEILEVYELASLIGAQTVVVGVQALDELLDVNGKK